MSLVRTLAAASLLSCFASTAFAQETCKDNDTESFETCWQSLYDSSKGPEANKFAVAETSNAKAEATKAQTGADSGGASTASTLTDLLPLFDALGLIGNSDQGDGTLALNLNFLLPMQEADKNMQLQLVVNTSPAPLTELVEAFPEAVRAARKDTLQKEISAFGESRAELTYSLVNSRFGRDFTVARKQLAPIYEGASRRAGATVDVGSKLDSQRAALRRISDNTIATAKGIGPATPFSAYPPELHSLRDELKREAADLGPAIGKTTLAAKKEFAGAGLSQLAALVEQQPQLLFSLAQDIRDEVAGPEKTSAKFTYEFTRHNFGSFLRGDGAVCKDADAVRQGGEAYVNCVDALSRYAGGTEEALKTQPRWKLSAAYQRVKAINYSYPGDNVMLSLPETDRIEVTAGWGRPLQSVKNADRVDVEVSYDSNADGDTSNKERLRASLTYTRRVAEMDVPFSIVYANKDEYLGEVDHQISLNFGIKFKPPATAGK
jgi:hypothetical protein